MRDAEEESWQCICSHSRYLWKPRFTTERMREGSAPCSRSSLLHREKRGCATLRRERWGCTSLFTCQYSTSHVLSVEHRYGLIIIIILSSLIVITLSSLTIITQSSREQIIHCHGRPPRY